MGSPRFMRTGLAFLLLLGIGPALTTGEADEPKEFILYTGANLKVLDGNREYLVVGVTEVAVQVEIDGKAEARGYDELGELWIDREMKLNALSATIQGIEIRKASATGRAGKVDWGSIAAGTYASTQGADSGKGGEGFDQSLLLNPGSSGFQTDSSSRPELPDEQTEPNPDLDALEVTFQLASEHAIPAPYLVLKTDYRIAGQPGAVFRKFHLEVVDGIGTVPRTVRLLQRGFPPGFAVDDYEVFLYSGRREVPTNLSDKQIALTRDEAMQYLILEYLVGHKGETLGPRPMWVGMPAETKKMVREGTANPSVQLSLDTKGRVTELEFLEGPDPDPAIVDAIRAFRFYPALEQGRAEESTYELRLKEVVR